MEKKKRNYFKHNRDTDSFIISGVKNQPFVYLANLPGHYDTNKRRKVFENISSEINEQYLYSTGLELGKMYTFSYFYFFKSLYAYIYGK